MDWNRPEMRQRKANYVPLTPVSFLTRAASFFGDRTAVVHGARRYNYREMDERCRRFAHALQKRGVKRGDTVAILAANTPAMLEAHYSVPMLGAVLNPINFRMDAPVIKFCLEHGEAKVLLADREFHAAIIPALKAMANPPLLIDIADAETAGAPSIGALEYEDVIKEGDPSFQPPGIEDEWESICLLYTSGTTGDPKGVVYSHRGAYLNAIVHGQIMGLDLATKYLWTLPMFHCSGWTFTWGVTAVAGTHVCLRKVDPKRIFELIESEGITILCGAPAVLNILANSPPEIRKPLSHKVTLITGGAAPPSAVIAAAEKLGFKVFHGYGLTETYAIATFSFVPPEWADLPDQDRQERLSRQGICHSMIDVQVMNPDTMTIVPRDGRAMGEIMVRGNAVMKGYLKNEKATDAAFAGGYFHSGDLAVVDADGYASVKDRSKDVIISGGENISSLEIEEILFRHPKVLEAAVVARPDIKWGETPCAFVTLKQGAEGVTSEEILAYCKDNMARFKVPRHVVFGPLPKTSTGKVQKFLLRENAKTVQ